MKIRVEKRHIKNGICKDSRCCMIADALRELLPDARYILVDLQTIRYSDIEDGVRYTYLTPAIAQRSLLRFDSGDKHIAPFTFTLTRPMAAPRRTGWKAYRSATATRKGKKYKKTGIKRQVVAYKERAFGLRAFSEKRAHG